MKTRLALLLLLLVFLAPKAWPETVFTLAIVPQFTAVDIGQRWAPLVEHIKRETGVTLQLRSTASIPAFEEEFMAGLPDFVFLNPYHMVMAAKARGYRPFLRSSQPLEGILVVKNSGPVQRLNDLNGGTLAFPAPNAFGASLYMRALLSEREGITFTPSYVGTHQNVYRHVFHGDALAGGGVESTLAMEPEGIRSQLRVLYRTPHSASHPLAVHPRVPRQVVDRVMASLRGLALTPEGKRLLMQVELDDAVVADYGRDYAPLEKLGLDRFVVGKRN